MILRGFTAFVTWLSITRARCSSLILHRSNDYLMPGFNCILPSAKQVNGIKDVHTIVNARTIESNIWVYIYIYIIYIKYLMFRGACFIRKMNGIAENDLVEMDSYVS